MSSHENDAGDPWTFFGQYRKDDLDGASRLLVGAKIQFEIKEATFDSDSEWSGPFALWIRDESAGQASALLVPYFASLEKRDA